MLTAILVALAVIALYMAFRYYRLKNDSQYKMSITEAYEKKDYDTYLAILNYKIAHTADIKDKNILSTLKINAYMCQGDWEKAQALYKQISLKKLPKKIKLTFLCNYITTLYLSDQYKKANAFVDTNKDFLKAGEESSLYQMYLQTFAAFRAFGEKDYAQAQDLFQDLKNGNISNDFFNGVFEEYLEKAKNAQSEYLN